MINKKIIIGITSIIVIMLIICITYHLHMIKNKEVANLEKVEEIQKTIASFFKDENKQFLNENITDEDIHNIKVHIQEMKKEKEMTKVALIKLNNASDDLNDIEKLYFVQNKVNSIFDLNGIIAKNTDIVTPQLELINLENKYPSFAKDQSSKIKKAESQRIEIENVIKNINMLFTDKSRTKIIENITRDQYDKVAEVVKNMTLSSFKEEFSDELSNIEMVILAKEKGYIAKEEEVKSKCNVIIGKEGWLFHNPSLDDFLATNTLKEKSVAQLKRTIELIKEYVESKGCEFYAMIGPNKNSIYPEFMSDLYVKGENKNNYQLVKDVLNDSDVNFIDIKDFLIKEKDKNIELYFKRDTHWNSYCAEKVYREIISRLNLKTNLPDKLSYSVDRFFTPDLYKMVLQDGVSKDNEFIYDIPKNYTGLKHEFDLKINTKLNDGNSEINPGKKLLIFRDSFFSLMIKFCSNDFIEVQYDRETPYNVEKAENKIVILEIVERHIPLIVKSAPIMLAPIRENVDLNEYEKINFNEVSFKKEEQNNMIHLYGYYKPNEIVSNKKVVVTCGEKVFEAFPILEEKIKNEAIDKYGENVINQGFSLRVPIDISNDLNDFSVYAAKR